MTTHVLTFTRICNVIDNVCNNNVNFHWENVYFKGDMILLLKSYDKTNLTLMIIAYEIY